MKRVSLLGVLFVSLVVSAANAASVNLSGFIPGYDIQWSLNGGNNLNGGGGEKGSPVVSGATDSQPLTEIFCSLDVQTSTEITGASSNLNQNYTEKGIPDPFHWTEYVDVYGVLNSNKKTVGYNESVSYNLPGLNFFSFADASNYFNGAKSVNDGGGGLDITTSDIDLTSGNAAFNYYSVDNGNTYWWMTGQFQIEALTPAAAATLGSLVPEPASLALLPILGLIARRRRH